jgi:hypothetical protein
MITLSGIHSTHQIIVILGFNVLNVVVVSLQNVGDQESVFHPMLIQLVTMRKHFYEPEIC